MVAITESPLHTTYHLRRDVSITLVFGTLHHILPAPGLLALWYFPEIAIKVAESKPCFISTSVECRVAVSVPLQPWSLFQLLIVKMESAEGVQAPLRLAVPFQQCPWAPSNCLPLGLSNVTGTYNL